jgi:hypothetical protein
MENSELIKVILTSTLIATVLSTIVSTIVAIKLKSLDYRNEYYKKILDKRLEAYKFLETQIAILKCTVLDDDKRPYHMIFSYGEDELNKFQTNLIAAFAYSIWIHEDTVSEMENLNQIFFKISHKTANAFEGQVIEFGKEFYNQISTSRNKLEKLVRCDLHNLHDLKKFIKEKKRYGMRTINIDN